MTAMAMSDELAGEIDGAIAVLWTALQDPDPVLIFEHGSLYNMQGTLPADAGAVDIRSASSWLSRRSSWLPSLIWRPGIRDGRGVPGVTVLCGKLADISGQRVECLVESSAGEVTAGYPRDQARCRQDLAVIE